MKVFFFTFLVTLATSAILEIKSDNYLDFSRSLSSGLHQPALIIFTEKKSLCPECHNYLMKDYFKLNDYMEGRENAATLAHIDCAYEFLICRKFHVQRFPHVAYINEGRAFVMQGNDALVTYQDMVDIIEGTLQLEG